MPSERHDVVPAWSEGFKKVDLLRAALVGLPPLLPMLLRLAEFRSFAEFFLSRRSQISWFGKVPPSAGLFFVGWVVALPRL